MLHYIISKGTGKIGAFRIVLIVALFFVGSSVTFSAAPRRRYHTVKPGDSLEFIAKQYDRVSVAEIVKENTIKDPDHIIPGQRLVIPWKGISHIVREGEYLEIIAKTYAKAAGVNWRDMMASIKQANGLYNPNKLRENQKLFIPGAKKALPIKIPKKEPQGVWHTIKQDGENIFRLALNYGEDSGISWKEMQERIMQHSHNKGIDPRDLQIGQKIFIPQAKKVLEIEIPPEVVAKEEAVSSVSEERISKAKEELIVQEPIFSWPVEGEIAEFFDGESNKGIEITISAGESVIAPADGVVTLAEETEELGRCLFIRHEKEGLISCFTRMPLSTYLVKEGDEVEKAQEIARIGTSEGTDNLELHFEVRKIGSIEPVNPLDYLP